MATDIQKLISEVAAKNRVLVVPDDPVFAVVTKNRLMPDEAVEGLLTRVGIAISRFEPSARPGGSSIRQISGGRAAQLDFGMEDRIAQDLNIANARCCEMIDKIHRAHSRPAMRRWGAVGLLTGLVLFGCGYFARDVYKIDSPVSASHDFRLEGCRR